MKVVYVIYNSYLKITKIGVSNNVKSRLMALESQVGVKLDLAYCTVPILNSFEIENEMHQIHKDYRLLGEWFNIEPKKAIKTLKSLKHKFKIEKYVEEYINGKKISQIAKENKISRQYLHRVLRYSLDKEESSINKNKLQAMVRANDIKIKMKRGKM